MVGKADPNDVVYGHERDARARDHTATQTTTRKLEDAYPAAATAAVALAQLHNHRPDSEWESEVVRTADMLE